MRRTLRLSRSRVALVAALAGSVVFALGSSAVALGAAPVKRISTDPYTNRDSNHRTEVEPDTFVFRNTVVATFQVGRFFDGGASNIGFATSTDGGQTWTHGFLPSTTVNSTPAGPYARASDPTVAFDKRHGVWMISWIGLFPGGNTSRVDVLVSRSTDGGKTFGAPVVVSASGNFNDKNWTVCDNTATSPFYGHCYTEFDDFTHLNRIQMSTSTDGGLTWGAAKTTPDQTCVIGGQPLVKPSGTVIVPIDDCQETAILSIRSTDGGATWQKPVLVALLLNDGNPGAIRAPALPTAEIDGSGRVYVVWPDCRFEAGCSAPIGTNDLLISSSANGVNWTLPARIPTAPVGSGADFMMPGLAVDRSTSGSSAHLGLTYYYFPNSNCQIATCRLRIGFVSSTNGGATWSSPTQLDGTMDVRWLPLTTQGFMAADYISTSIVPQAENATPAVIVARPPATPPACSNLANGAPGQDCDVAAYTASPGLLAIVGGSNPATRPAHRAVTRPHVLSGRQTAY